VKGPSACCPQPEGPTAGWPRSVVVSAIDLQAPLGEVLRNSSASSSKVLDPCPWLPSHVEGSSMRCLELAEGSSAPLVIPKENITGVEVSKGYLADGSSQVLSPEDHSQPLSQSHSSNTAEEVVLVALGFESVQFWESPSFNQEYRGLG
jgi:hypothetical protein